MYTKKEFYPISDRKIVHFLPTRLIQLWVTNVSDPRHPLTKVNVAGAYWITILTIVYVFNANKFRINLLIEIVFYPVRRYFFERVSVQVGLATNNIANRLSRIWHSSSFTAGRKLHAIPTLHTLSYHYSNRVAIVNFPTTFPCTQSICIFLFVLTYTTCIGKYKQETCGRFTDKYQCSNSQFCV